MYQCHDKNLELIQPLVQEFTFCVYGFGPLAAKPRIRSKKPKKVSPIDGISF
jgi:hypothetical protein